MVMNWIGNFICLFISIQLIGANIQHDNSYGIVVVRNTTAFNGVYYTFSPVTSPTSNEEATVTVKGHACSNTNITTCINEIKVKASFQDIPINKIFLKIYYYNRYLANLEKHEFDQVVQESSNVVRNYFSYPKVAQLERYTLKKNDLLAFALTNINIKTEEIDPNVALIFESSIFYIGFLTDSPEKFSPELLHTVQYKSRHYSIVANSFICARPKEVNYLIYKEIIQNSEGNNPIYHPCITTGSYIIFNPVESDSLCVEDFGITNAITFHGLFNKDLCTNLIKQVVVENRFDLYPPKLDNFAQLSLPLPVQRDSSVTLYTSLFVKYPEKGEIFETLRQIESDNCYKATEQSQIVLPSLACLEALYLQYVLDDVLEHYVNFVILNTKRKPTTSMRRFIFADPNLGFLLENDSNAIALSTTTTAAAAVAVTTEKVKSSKGMHPILIVILTMVILLVMVVLIGIFVYLSKTYSKSMDQI